MQNKKNCYLCVYSRRIPLMDDLLCKYAGVIKPNNLCNRFRASKTVTIQDATTCSECSSFQIDDPLRKSCIGHCTLFGHKQYDGSLRIACSRYTCGSGCIKQ